MIQGIVFVGQKLRLYVLPIILWVMGLGFVGQALESGPYMVLYTSNTVSEWLTYTDPLYGQVSQGYIVQNAFVGVPIRLVYSILFLLLAYKLTPKLNGPRHQAGG